MIGRDDSDDYGYEAEDPSDYGYGLILLLLECRLLKSNKIIIQKHFFFFFSPNQIQYTRVNRNSYTKLRFQVVQTIS